MSLWRPSKKALMLPGSPERRLIHRPDLRGIVTPQQSGERLFDNEVDYDDLAILRQWREYETERPNEVRHFMMEVAQRNPGEQETWRGFKAIRFIRLTRVPRWLRQQGGGVGRAGTPHMTYVLSALREQGVLFIQLITKTANSRLIFAYGVQALGSTEEEAKWRADEAYAALEALLNGTFQQIEFEPLTVQEGEMIVENQATWRNVAIARGRPMENGGSVGAMGVLDGNRTDTESSNQIEAFIRGMSETKKGFALTVISAPIAISDMTIAVANVARSLSVVRSETRGNRAFTAGAAIPLTVGAGEGIGTSDSHSESVALGTSTSDGTSFTESAGTSHSSTYGTSTSESTGFTESESTTNTTSSSTTNTTTHGTSEGVSESVANGTSRSDTVGVTDTVSKSTSVGVTDSISRSASSSVADGTNWSSSTSSTTGTSSSTGSSSSQTSSANASQTETVGGSVLLLNGSEGQTVGTGEAVQSGSSSSSGSSQSSTNSSSAGGSRVVTTGASTTASQSVTQTTTNSTSQAVSQSTTVGTSQTHTSGTSSTTSQSEATGVTRGTSVGQTTGTSTTSTSGTGTNQSSTSGSSTGTASGVSHTAGTSQQMADAYAVAMSRQASSTGSLGVIPSFGVSVSKETLDASKKLVGDILESTLSRYVDGVESGGFLYSMFLTAEDSETLHAAAALLKSAFWGPGSSDVRLGQPFHVVSDFARSGLVDEQELDDERQRLLTHAQAFSTYRRREPTSEIIEPFIYSSYVSSGELAIFARPPVAESIGLLAVHDSAPVMAMPGDRENCDLHLGYVFNGERGRVSGTRMGVDVSSLTHCLVSGATGSGKTTTLLRLLSELVTHEETIMPPPSPSGLPQPSQTVTPGVLCLDWMANCRNLGSIVEPVAYDPVTGERTGRFQVFSVRGEGAGRFTWNPLAIPAAGMNPIEWAAATADSMVASWNLGEAGRSLIAEMLDELYSANRLEDTVLVKPRILNKGHETDEQRIHEQVLPAVDRATLPADAIQIDLDGNEFVNVHSCPELSRTIGLEHLALKVYNRMCELATPEGGRLGTSLRDRVQSLWRRIQYFMPGGMLSDLIRHDPSLNVREVLTLEDIVDTDAGLVTVIETDGLDMANRRLILGSVILALYRSGLQGGEGHFNHSGQGPGLFVVLEEAHELFGSDGDGSDRFSAETRTALFESLHRRVRALGVRLIDVVQNPGDISEAITSNLSTVFVHRAYSKADRERIANLLSWANQLGQHQREVRFLGELPVGHVIARFHARDHYLESAPIHFVAEMPTIAPVTDDQLTEWAALRTRPGTQP